MSAKAWLDFNQIRDDADVQTVLDQLGLLDRLTASGDEWVGRCPLGTKPHGKKDSFSFNTEKKTFQCFACKARGSILDFVAQLQNIHIREAGTLIQDIMSKPPEREAEAKPVEQEHGAIEHLAPPVPADRTVARASYLNAVMTVETAGERLKAGTVKRENLIVIDVEALHVLNKTVGDYFGTE